MSTFDLAIRIILSAFIGGLIGLEREIHGRAAGFRTHMLVCVGSSLFMIMSLLIARDFSSLGPVDPSRIASGVVTGIGFLGAGAVLRFQSTVYGLTTAAGIWAVSAIGLAIGAGYWKIGLVTAGVVFAVLLMSRIKNWIDAKRESNAGTGTEKVD